MAIKCISVAITSNVSSAALGQLCNMSLDFTISSRNASTRVASADPWQPCNTAKCTLASHTLGNQMRQYGNQVNSARLQKRKSKLQTGVHTAYTSLGHQMRQDGNHMLQMRFVLVRLQRRRQTSNWCPLCSYLFWLPFRRPRSLAAMQHSHVDFLHPTSLGHQMRQDCNRVKSTRLQKKRQT